MAPQEEPKKHSISPQPDPAVTKKSRALYFVESPRGTLRETQPSAVHQLGDTTMPPPNSRPMEVPSIKIEDTDAETFGPLRSTLPIRSGAAPTLSDPLIASSEHAESAQDPKQGDRAKNTNYDLSQEHLNTLSVREKLRKGIAMGFANNLAYENATKGMVQSDSQRNPHPLSANSMTVASIMRSTAREHHMAPGLFKHHLKGERQPTEMVNHEVVAAASGVFESQDAREKRMEHKNTRMANVLAASQRLQAITGTANYNRFTPDVPLPKLPQGQTMHDHKNNKSTRLELDDGPWISPNGKYSKPAKIDTKEGSITMYEANIVCGNPPSLQNWIWFKIAKPLLASGVDRPDDFGAAPTSILTFAIPAAKIEKSKTDLPARLGDFGRLKMDAYTDATKRQFIQEWRFSKDGIPIFTISPHPQVMADREFPPDFLWIETVPTFEDVRTLDTPQGQKVWWRFVRQQAKQDWNFWFLVQKLMGSNVCLVEATSKKGAGWVRFNPEPQQQNKGPTPMPESAPVNRRAAARGAFGLRNEVQDEQE
ncbi:hypothetical protein FLONG3_3834 [Fusarium longipes]|uniref:Uncharacterized protein n=1 Tax=Fusarium longipes TaxID=694270 RepID=A0A395T0W7_9HYPO|nr:hypothetical protein FLONG3_3834 [Fusarium longipes]